MGLIKASLADVSTDFKPLEPGIYLFDIAEVEEVERDNQVVAYRIKSKVMEGELEGRTFSDYVNIISKKGEVSEIGLTTLKRYFEVTHGKDEVAGWTDDDYDTDLLVGKSWRGQLEIRSYTPEGETEPRQTNRVKRMEEV